METVAIQEQELKQQALSIVEQAKIVKITDQDSYVDACSLLIDQIKPLRRKWKDYWDPLRDSTYKAYQAVLGKHKEGDSPLELAETQVKSAISKWDAEQERIHRELQAQAQRDAEAAAQAEIDKQAVFAELSGADEEQVAAIAAQPVNVVAPMVEPTYQKVSGVSKREQWKCRVNNMRALCAAIGKGSVPITYVLPNEKALNARVAADRQTMNLPGCVAYAETIIAGKSK